MDFKKMSLGLGVFSIALGAAEVFGSRRIATALEAEGSERLIKGFGARELFAGASLLISPAVSTNVWGRVLGDVMDVSALGFAAKAHPRNKAVQGALAFVLGALALDLFVARGLDKKTGKMLPILDDAQDDTIGVREAKLAT
jgi:hypothetical protein